MKKIRHLTDGGSVETLPECRGMSGSKAVTAIAIVEDNDTMRQSLVELINGNPGCRCVCACSNASQALAEVPRHAPEVVLMDIHMPGESGIVCTARLTALMPRVQVIILTVYKDIKLIFQALKAGACGYVLKHNRPEEILAAIEEVRTGGAPMTGEIARMVVRSFREPQPSAPADVGLSERETLILVLLAEGLSNKEIATRLNISPATVRTHVTHVFEKLHVRCRSEAVARYFQVHRADSAPPPAGS